MKALYHRPLVLLLGLISSGALAQTPAFPGAMGFGVHATGGRGGTVYHVTTLADSGAGSFRTGVSSPNRIIVFDVGGYINLLSAVSVRENITIAGQTAPGGGIGFKGGKISFGSRNNIICRHIRIRPGSDTASNEDVALNLYNARNIIVDHVSVEFAPWNNIGAVSDDWQNSPVTDVTFQNCLNANPTYQQFGAHTESVNSTMAWFYTIFANSHNRNPMSKINDVFVNNVLYNCDAGYTTHTSTEFSHDLVNNYFIAGPASTGNLPWYQVDNNQSIYYSGNYYDGDENGVLGGGITTPYWYQGPPYGTVLPSSWSSLTTTSVLYSARAAYRVALSQAGAFPRDAMDDLVISQVKTLGNAPAGTGAGTAGPIGSLYTSQTQTGLPNNGYGIINGGTPAADTDGDGMPDYFEQANGFNLASNDAMIIGGDGYARVEKYINWLADPHASTTTNTPVAVDLWQYTSGFTNNSPVYSVSSAVNGSVTISNSHYAVFTPAASFIGMGGYVFRVTSADGSAYTNTVSVAISALQPPSNLVWAGDGGANIWTNGGPANWLKDGNPVAFNAGDRVTFDDSGSSSPPITLAAPIAPGSMSFVASQDYTIGGGGTLIGSGSLYKVGQGKLTLNALNTFSGGVTINEGVVQLGNETSLNGSISGNVTNNDTLILANLTAVTSAASISGSGQVIKRGSGTHTLSGVQSYTNLTTVEAGALVFSSTPPAGNIANAGVLTFSPAASLTYGGVISGPGAVTIGASGQTVTLSGANTFSGGLNVTAGNIQLAHNRAAGTGAVTNSSSGLIYVGNGVIVSNDLTLTTSTTDLNLRCDSGTGVWAGNITNLGSGVSWRPGSDGGTLVFAGNALMGARNFIVPRGAVHFASNAVVSATGSATALGRDTSGGNRSLNLTLRDNASLILGACSIGGGQNGNNVTVTIQNNASLVMPTNTLNLHNITRSTSVSTLRLNGGTLTVNGFSKSQNYTNVLNFNGGVLRASAPAGTLILPNFLPINSWQTACVQSGGAIIDAGHYLITIAQPLIHDPALGATLDGGLTKLGAGGLGLNGLNTFTGPTKILDGTLLCGPGAITNSASIYIASGAEMDTQVNGTFTLTPGRTLSGNGNFNGDFILGTGAVLTPGTNGIGRFTFIRVTTFETGSTNRLELNKASLTNDTVKVWQSLTLGGALIVTNLSGALAAGDSFKLFDATGYSGSFSTVILPPLAAGLAWNTNQLNSAGIITVVSIAPPVFGAAQLIGNDLILSGSNGSANGNYYVLTSTNVGAPLANWLRLTTNQFDAAGRFNFTNPVNPLTPQLFHRLQLP